MHTHTSRLLEPYTSPALRLPNRVVMAPMTRGRADAEGVPGTHTAAYYAQRASAGLIITEGIYPHAYGLGGLGVPGLVTTAQVDAWRGVTKAVHASGGRIYAQLWHVGRLSHPAFLPGGDAPLAPSALAAPGYTHIASGRAAYPVPRAMSRADIAEAVEAYANAARNAVAAGFDGVEIHGANGYLVSQFLSDNANRRTDEYGGSVNGRIRFAVESVEAVAAAIGAERTALRISPANPDNGLVEEDPATLHRALLGAVDGLGLAYLHVSEKGAYPALADLRGSWNGTLIGNYSPAAPTEPAAGERLLADGLADAVAFGRLFIANPDLPVRLAVGAELAEYDASDAYRPGLAGYADHPAVAAPFVPVGA